MFDKTVAQYGQINTIEFQDRIYTLHDFDQLTHKLAEHFYALGIKIGHVVPLFANNSPEYLMMWIALCRIGASAGLINTNLKNDSLKHCLEVSFDVSKHHDKKFVIFDSANAKAITELQWGDESGDESGDNGGIEHLVIEDLIAKVKDNQHYTVPRSYTRDVKFSDPLYYIYTSGTTGMPKAAKISHLRFLVAGYAFPRLYGLNEDDKMYVSLPLYHSNGGMVGVGSAFTEGMDLFIREKFSARGYFKDCAKNDCTVGVYIGECCRYILGTPDSIYDKSHKMRMLIGNGMRPEVWGPFVKRFEVQIGEFYGSTEGNANLFNTVGQIGAIGYLPGLLRMVYPVKFIKYNRETDELVRNLHGFCVECDYGEVGEAIGLIKDNDATRKFDGYTNKEDSEKKIIQNVFKSGDKWFRSGDLLRMDEDEFVYFVDRIGDTFRWKGENVATTEVSLAITKEPQVRGVGDVNVYGVKVPNCQDGRIGMMSIRKQTNSEGGGGEGEGGEAGDGDDETKENNLNNDIDFDQVFAKAQSLPRYAQPHFIRILPEADMTGTFKHKKVKLRDEGFDISIVKDPVYIMDRERRTYIPLTQDIYDGIVTGTVRI